MVAEANSVCSGRGLACRLPDDCCTLLTVERLSLGPPSITADPMLMEAEALGTSYHTHARVSSSTAGSTDIRLDAAPIQETMLHNQVALESVRFEIDSIDQVARSPDSRRNVTVSRGSQEAPPLLLSPDVSSPIKKVVSDFAADVCRAASPAVLASTPPRRRARTPQLPATIRRSERLAKKSRHRATKPVLQAQNVMMRRLGLTSACHPPDTSSFQQFTDTFYSTLSSSQCEALDALLPSGLSSFGNSEGDDLL
jgi:hypothetical protein